MPFSVAAWFDEFCIAIAIRPLYDILGLSEDRGGTGKIGIELVFRLVLKLVLTGTYKY